MKSCIILPLGFSLFCTAALLCTAWSASAGEVDSTFENQVELSAHKVKLSPVINAKALDVAASEIPLDAIYSFLVNHRAVNSSELDQSGYIVAGKNGRIIMGKGDTFYARGHFDVPEGSTFGIYQKGESYKDPDTGEALGLQLVELGVARIEQIDGDVATMQLLSSHRDIHLGDRLLPTLEKKLDSVFMPAPPSAPVAGKIIQVVEGVRNIGQYTSVVINRGKREGLVSGNVLSVYSQGERVRDAATKKLIQLPLDYAGTLMVYRVFDKVSFGLILNAKKAMTLHDIVKTP